jgi:hypothetical protein
MANVCPVWRSPASAAIADLLTCGGGYCGDYSHDSRHRRGNTRVIGTP